MRTIKSNLNPMYNIVQHQSGLIAPVLLSAVTRPILQYSPPGSLSLQWSFNRTATIVTLQSETNQCYVKSNEAEMKWPKRMAGTGGFLWEQWLRPQICGAPEQMWLVHPFKGQRTMKWTRNGQTTLRRWKILLLSDTMRCIRDAFKIKKNRI